MRKEVTPHPADSAAPVLGAGTQPACFQSASLRDSAAGVSHGFSGGFPRVEDAAFAGQVRLWLNRELGPGPDPLVLMAQPHGGEIADLTDGQPEAAAVFTIPGVDGVTAGGRVTPVLLVKSADCVPILALDPEGRRCAALHAGWRGVAAGILPTLLERWRSRGCRLEHVRLVFGPHIRACCFQVRQDCLDHFASVDLDGAVSSRSGASYLALETVLRTQARRWGVADRQIETLALCTDCHRSPQGETVFASYRRAGRQGLAAGRNLSFIALRQP